VTVEVRKWGEEAIRDIETEGKTVHALVFPPSERQRGEVKALIAYATVESHTGEQHLFVLIRAYCPVERG